MISSSVWYVVKAEDQSCRIVSVNSETGDAASEVAASPEKWGPFESQAEAIARRVGLIRAGKCKPV